MNEVALRLASRLFDTPIMENQFRSTFVEEMIAPFLAVVGWKYTGASWSGWDFEHADGAKLELKQSTAMQPWSEARNMKSKGVFDIATRTGHFSEGGSKWTAAPGRPAHLYVFAWNAGNDHRDEKQWSFYVVPTASLPSQKTISLSRIVALAKTTGQHNPASISELVARITEFKAGLLPALVDSVPQPA